MIFTGLYKGILFAELLKNRTPTADITLKLQSKNIQLVVDLVGKDHSNSTYPSPSGETNSHLAGQQIILV
jgi:hypothetical protein